MTERWTTQDVEQMYNDHIRFGKSIAQAKELDQMLATKDPWRHRSQGMRCATCMWWVEKETHGERVDPLGRCRRHAPTMGGFPVTYSSDWCGDHRLDENHA